MEAGCPKRRCRMNEKRVMNTLSIVLLCLAGGPTAGIAQEPLAVTGVIDSVPKSDKDPTLVEYKGALTFNDAAKKLVFNAGKQSFEAGYDSVRRIVFDEATHMHLKESALRQIGHGNYWMYVEYAAPSGATTKHMLQIPALLAAQVLDRAKLVFGGRVAVTDVRVGESIDRDTLSDVKSKHTFELADRENHPIPEVKSDKALIVVVYPVFSVPQALGGKQKFKAGQMGTTQVKIHANGRVVLVNRLGSYGFAYLDPGSYQIAARGNGHPTSALKITAEAGKTYYFLEEDRGTREFLWNLVGPGYDVQLSQHSPELVMHKLSEADFGVWTRKSD